METASEEDDNRANASKYIDSDKYKPTPEYKPTSKKLTKLYKPRAYIRRFTVFVFLGAISLHSFLCYKQRQI